MATLGIYNTAETLEMMEFTRAINPFWLSFFTREMTFDTEAIYWDKVFNDTRRLAPLVVPNVQGRNLTLGGFTGVSFRPAYVKPKHAIDPNMVLERRPGEGLIGGSRLSPAQRRDAVIAQIMQIHRTLITNREEWLAARAIIDGSVTLADEDYPSTTVSFQRDSTLSYTLTGTAKWSDAGSDPLADIRAARLNANVRSGANIQKWIFGATAWSLFTTRVDVNKLLNENVQQLSADKLKIFEGFEGQTFQGVIRGNAGDQLELIVDTSKYVDSAGAEQFFLDQKKVVGVGTGVQGIRCYGAIKDFDAGPNGLAALRIFTKMWRNQDPSAEFVLSQSAPLMVPREPNATTSILVD